ncbi:MAG: ribokinase, partial [Turicibacter sp.]
MKILNFGSCNMDYFYDVDHMVLPGETLSANTQTLSCGGKGLNQSIALAKAGAEVYHAGCIGTDGAMLKQTLEDNQVNCEYLKTVQKPSGHAIIQRDAFGENSIILFKGANFNITREMIDDVLSGFNEGDFILLQNEINEMPYIMQQAAKKGMQVVLNPAPFHQEVKSFPLHHVNYFIVNEIEGHELSGVTEPSEILKAIATQYPNAHTILTLGSKGVLYGYKDEVIQLDALKVRAVDTTAAGDTFIGYFLSAIAKG